MKYSKLANYLSEIGENMMRVQIAKQILTENMNFCPAWLISKMQQKAAENSQKTQSCEKNHLNSQNLKTLFKLIKFECSTAKTNLIFEYFGLESKDEISFKNFIQLLLPNTKQALRKAAMKRNPLDIEFTQQLKYSLKRLFVEITKMTEKLKLSFQDIKLLNSQKTQSNKIQFESLQGFMKREGKYASEIQISLILNFMDLNRCKELNTIKIVQIINEFEMQMSHSEQKNSQVEHQQIEESFTILSNSNHNSDKKKEEPSILSTSKLDSSQANTTYQSKANKFLIQKSRNFNSKLYNNEHKDSSLSVSKLQDQTNERESLKYNQNRQLKTKKANSIIFSQQSKQCESNCEKSQKEQQVPENIFSKIKDSQTKKRDGIREMYNIKYSSRSKLNQQNNAQYLNTKRSETKQMQGSQSSAGQTQQLRNKAFRM